MSNVGFTVKNLALVGALDDFYELYLTIKRIYEAKGEKYIKENGSDFPLLSKTWDELCAKAVRKACEPYLQKYLYLYADGYNEVFAYVYAFQDFSFIDKLNMTEKRKERTPFAVGFKSFSDFLIEFQMIATCLDCRKNYIKNPKHTFHQSWLNITERIENIAKEYIKEYTNATAEIDMFENNVLYVFDKLSNVYCYKENHSIVPARFTATIVKTGRVIVLPVHYCTLCGMYFIGSKTLSVFEKTFGKLVLNKERIEEAKFDFSGFGSESNLHQLGYNVVEGNLTENERKELLIYLLKNKFISYIEICATIEHNINIFQYSVKHKAAVEKWKVDLKVIGDYVKENPEMKN